MVFASALLVSGLAVAVAAPIASSTATVDASYLWGTWELTGIGQPNNRATVTAHRMTFVFDSAGWREIFWEDAGMTRHEYAGDYALSGDLLSLTDRRGNTQRCRVTWSPSSLVLEFTDDSPKSPPIGFYFEKRAWVSP